MQQYHSYFNFFWRFIKVVPVIGMFFVLANAGNLVRRKGYVIGTIEVALDLCPVVCLVKAGIETYTGDIFPEKATSAQGSLQTTAELA